MDALSRWSRARTSDTTSRYSDMLAPLADRSGHMSSKGENVRCQGCRVEYSTVKPSSLASAMGCCLLTYVSYLPDLILCREGKVRRTLVHTFHVVRALEKNKDKNTD